MTNPCYVQSTSLRPHRRQQTLGFCLALVALAFAGAAPASAQRTGNFCMTDLGGNSCTANDLAITGFEFVTLVDGCSNFTGDTATVVLRTSMTAASASRYDLGITIDLSGSPTGAYDGDNCYHDYFPAPLSNTATPPGPPYRDDDGNVCGDGGVAGNTWVRTHAQLTITCADNFPVGNPDGIADVQICNSWKQNTGTCTGVAGAVPGAPSKCRCQTYNLFSPTAVVMKGFGAGPGSDRPIGILALAVLGMLGLSLAVQGRRRE